MKQTSSAIAFLIAQYRAIFKNAFLKGMATALVVAVPLYLPASYAANSALPSITNKETLLDHDIFIDSGSPDTNVIKNAYAGEATLNGLSRSIIIDVTGDDVSQGLFISPNDAQNVAHLFVNVKNVYVKSGTLRLGGSQVSSESIYTSNVVNIGGYGKKGIVEFVDGSAYLGTGYDPSKNEEGTNITVGSQGLIKVKSQTKEAEGHVDAGIFTMNDGEINVNASTNAKSNLNIKTRSGSITGSKIFIGNENDAQYSVLNMSFHGGSFNIADSEITLGKNGYLMFDNGTLNIDSDCFVAPEDLSKAGNFDVGGGGVIQADLAIAHKVNMTIENGGILDLGTMDLDLTDEASSNKVKFVDGEGSAVDGSIGLKKESSTVKVNSLTINDNKQAHGGTFNMDTLYVKGVTKVAGSHYLVANTLDVEDTTTLGGKVTLSSLDSGKVSGDGSLVVGNGGTLNVERGAWALNSKLVLGTDTEGGELKVGSKEGASATNMLSSNLSVGKGQSFILKSGTITVGAEQNTNALLDISDAKVDLQNALDGSKVLVKNNSTLVINADDAVQLTKNKFLHVLIDSGSTMFLDGQNATFDMDKFLFKENLGAKGKIGLIGKLVSNNTITLDGSTRSQIRTHADGVVEADTLKFTGSANNEYRIISGTYIAGSSLSAGSQGVLLLHGDNVNAAKIVLGRDPNSIAQYAGLGSYTATGGASTNAGAAEGFTGTIDASSIQFKNGGTISVAYGKWSGGYIAVNYDGGMPGQGLDNAVLNVQDGASLALDRLYVNKGTVDVYKGGTLEVEAFNTVQGESILNIEGTLTIKGSKDTVLGATNKGIAVESDQFTIKAGGNVIIQDDALSLIKTDGTTAGFGAGVFKSEAGSTLTLAYGADQSFTMTEIGELRKALISGSTGDSSINSGFLNLGAANISGVNIVDNKVSWTDAQKAADVQSTNFALSEATVTNITASDEIYGSFGSLALDAASASSSQITVGGALVLQNAAYNGGYFASDATASSEKGLNIKKGTTVLADGGKVGTITLADDTSLVISSGEGETVIKGGIEAAAASPGVPGSAGNGGKVDLAGAVAVEGNVVAQSLNVGSGKTVISGGATTNTNIDVASGAELAVGGILKVKDETDIEGSVSASRAEFADALNVTGTLKLAGETKSDGVLTVAKGLTVEQGLIDAKTVDVSASDKAFTITDGGKVVADLVLVHSDSVIKVGHVDDSVTTLGGNAGGSTGGNAGGGNTGGGNAGSGNIGGNTGGSTGGNGSADTSALAGTGYLDAGRVMLNGASLVVDPAFGQKASVAALLSVGDENSNDVLINGKLDNAGKLTGKIYALQNAVVSLGANIDEATAALSEAGILVDGKLSDADGKVGSIVYLAKNIKVDGAGAGLDRDQQSYIVIDKKHNSNNYNDKTVVNYLGDLYIGEGSALVLADNAVLNSTTADGKQEAAIVFDKSKAVVHVESGGSVILAGKNYNLGTVISLFRDTDPADSGVKISGNDLTVRSSNGVFVKTFSAGSGAKTDAFVLQADVNAAKAVFNDGSAAANHTAFSYAVGFKELDSNNQGVDGTQIHSGKITKKQWELLDTAEQAQYTANADQSFYYKNRANKFLNNIVFNGTSSKDIDRVSRAPAFTGVAHATLLAGNVMADAIAQHVAMGSSIKGARGAANKASMGASALSASNMGANGMGASAQSASVQGLGGQGGVLNASAAVGASAQSTAAQGLGGQGFVRQGAFNSSANDFGGSLFVSPIYSKYEADSLDAQGSSYGVDVNLYGAVVGADFNVLDGLKIGGVITVGKGDSEGALAAAGASNDFSFYGVGLFGSYDFDKKLKVVGDISYTVLSNDLEFSLDTADKVATSLDSTSLSAGIAAQYAMTFKDVEVVPHAGIRYTRVESDDYSVAGAGSYKGEELSVISIPVGVSVAASFKADDWVFKPSFDVSLSANLGDDSLEGSFKWEAVEDFNSSVESQLVDDLSYEVSAGVVAQSGAFAGALGVSYSGSSNVDSFGVTASVQYVF